MKYCKNCNRIYCKDRCECGLLVDNQVIEVSFLTDTGTKGKETKPYNPNEEMVGPLEIPCKYCSKYELYSKSQNPSRADEATLIKMVCRNCNKRYTDGGH